MTNETETETNPAADTVTPSDAAAMAGEGESVVSATDARDTEIASLKDQLLRAAAETENVRRRLSRERDDAAAYVMTGFARDLLTVADNLARALAATAPEARADPAVKALVEGVEATERELMRVLARHGVSRIEAVGQPLDPNRHQAMLEVETAEVAPGHIVSELMAGFLIKDRLLRPAMVSVAKAPPAAGITE